MADFDLEQLKTLFENLGDRLERTKGDQLTNTELTKIRNIMSAMSKQMDNKDPSKPVEPKKVIDEFWRQWRSEDPFKEVREQKSAGGQPRGTIIKELQDARKGLGDYTDEFNRRSRTFGDKLTGFSNKLGEGSKQLDSFYSSIKQGGIMGGLGAMFGGAFDKINNYINDKASDYRTMLASEGSISSVAEMNNAANNAAMSTRELAAAMADGADSARKLGALKWSSLTQTLNKSAKLVNELGVGFEGRQDGIAAFVEIASKQGNLQRLSTGQMASGIEQLVSSADETAHILGLTRKEALDRAKEQAQNHVQNALIRKMGFNNNSVTTAQNVMGELAGPLGQKLLTQVLATKGQGPTSKDTAVLANTNPQLVAFARSLYQQMEGGGKLDINAVRAQGQGVANSARNSDTTGYLAQLASAADNLDSNLVGAIESTTKTADFEFNNKPNAKADESSQAVLGKEMLDREAVAALNSAVDTLANSIMKTYGDKLKDLTDVTTKAIEQMKNAINGLQETNPETVANVGIGLGALAMTLGALKMGRTGAALSGLARGGGAAGGLGRGPAGPMDIVRAQRGVPAGASSGAGNTAIQRLMTGGKNALGKAGGAAKALGGIRGNALIGSLFESYDYLAGNKEMSWKNLAKSSLRVGGGAVGGLAGGLAGGGIASAATGVAGGMAGYKAGDLLADAIFGADDLVKPSNAAKTPVAQSPRAVAQRNAAAAGNATPSQRGKNALSMDQMTSKIMENADRSASYLKNIKDQTDKQTELMREEIAAIRTMSDRVGRLLEDSNKNTKAIADHTV